MRTTVIAILILATAPAFAQQIEHAATVAQCQADQRLWLSRMEDTDDKLKDVTFDVLGRERCRSAKKLTRRTTTSITTPVLRSRSHRLNA
jgi:hypothetical protein